MMSREGGSGSAGPEAMDVWREGDRTRRGVPTEATAEGLRLGELLLPYGSIYWISRRSGLLMVFGRDENVAVKGSGDDLDRLARTLERRVDRSERRSRLLDPIADEVILFTAGVVAMGRMGERAVKGLKVAAVTRRALHLLGRGANLRIGWPADEAERERKEGDGRARDLLRVRKGEDELRLLYLFSEEIDAALRAASGSLAARESAGPRSRKAVDPSDVTAGEAGPGESASPDERAAADPDRRESASPDAEDSMEMFARREVARPLRLELPRLSVSVDTLQEEAAGAAERFRTAPADRAGLGPHFFETHFLELGEIALGPLLLRKSAASGARDLRRAVEAMDPGDLQEDTGAAISNAAGRLQEVYEEELGRLLEAKRAPARLEEEHRLGEEEAEELRLRMQGHFETLIPLFRALEERQVEVLRELEAFETGPPDGEEERVRAAVASWKEALRRVDRAYESAWREMVEGMAEAWEDRLLPRLARIASMRRRRFPEWVQLLLIGAFTVLAAAAIMIFLVW